MEIRDILRLTRKWLWLLLLAGLIGAAAGLAVDLLQPRVYQSSATLFVNSPNHSNYDTLLGNQQAAKALVSFPQSDPVLRATLQVVGNGSLSLPQLASMVSVANDLNTQFVVITVRDSDPKRAALLASEIARQSITQFEEMVTDPSSTQLAQDLQYQVIQLATEIKNTEAEIQNQGQQLSNIENQPVADPAQQTARIEAQISRLDQLNSTLNGLRASYSSLYGEQVSYFDSLSNTQVTLLQDAQVPQNPVRLQRTVAIAIGGLAGLIAIVGVIVFIEQADDVLRTPAKIVKATTLSILMAVEDSPATSTPLALLNGFSARGDEPLKDSLSSARAKQASSDQTYDQGDTLKLVSLKAKQSIAVQDELNNGEKARYQLREEFLTMGVFLSREVLSQQTTNGSKSGSLLVTSPENGDGKTLIASQIALGLARLRVKVVLVDANLRNPKVHTLFGLSNRVGLSTLLTDNKTDNTINAVLQQTDEPNLAILAAGPAIGSPPELLVSPMLATIINQLSENAYVVIDSSAILTSSESVIMANKSESALIVVDAHHTTANKLKRSLEILTFGTADVLGVVLNRAGKEY